MRFAFLEGGVGWASQLFGDLIEHWERRSTKALERMHHDKLDRAKLMSLVEQCGYSDIAAALRERGGQPDPELDVIDIRHPLPEAYGLVENGQIAADDFRAFNAVKMWGTVEWVLSDWPTEWQTIISTAYFCYANAQPSKMHFARIIMTT